MSGGASLVTVIQRLLERTYRMCSGVGDVGRFIVGDAGYSRLYGDDSALGIGSWGQGAATMIRETPEGVRASIYYPDSMIRRLEAHPPLYGLHDDNVDAFATLVEELDHFLIIAERARQERPLTLFELELHANVSKYLVLTRFLSKDGRGVTPQGRIWLRHHLFEKVRYNDPDAGVRQRYREAARWAVKLLDGLGGLDAKRRVRLLRRFHEFNSDAKVRLIHDLAA